MNAMGGDPAGSRGGPSSDGPGRWIMVPVKVTDLPDVPTAGCDEGVEFVFLGGDDETAEAGLAGERGRGEG